MLNEKTERELLEAINQKLELVLSYIVKAEAEVPEDMRRFTMYYHDLLHIRWGYEEKGLPIPTHIDRSIEYCHDRYEYLLQREENQGGTFWRNRQSLHSLEDVGNRYHPFKPRGKS